MVEFVQLRVMVDGYMFSWIRARSELLGLTPGEFVAAAVHCALDSEGTPDMEQRLMQYAGRERLGRESH